MPMDDRLGTVPVKRLLLRMSLPMILSLLAQAVNNVADGVFVARLGEEALAAVTLALPVQLLLLSTFAGVGAGTRTLVSMNLGGGDRMAAERAAGNGLLLSLLCCGIFTLAGLLLVERYFAFQASRANMAGVVALGTDYLRICLALSLGSALHMSFEHLLQASGRMGLSMLVRLTATVVNVLLNPLFIFGLLGFPALGVRGAAIATVAGQLAAAGLGICLHWTKNREVRLSCASLRPDGATVRRILAVGLPMGLRFVVYVCMAFALNWLLLAHSLAALAVCGVFFKLQSFIFFPVIGLSNGLSPIVSYNLGTRAPARARQAVSLGLLASAGFAALAAAILFLCAPRILDLFGASDAMLRIGVPALRIIALSLIPAAFSICAISALVAAGRGAYALAGSLCRQLLFLLPAALLLSRLFGLGGVWWAFPITDMASAMLCAVLLRRGGLRG